MVFLGSDAIALPLLESVASLPELAVILGVFTQPDRPAGRGQQTLPNAIKQWAIARGLPVLQPAKLGADSEEALRALAPDLCVVMAYGQILRDSFIAIPRLGTVNFHTSILPKYRGASPIQTAVASGEIETGVSLMRIVRELDAGPVAAVSRVPIGPLDTALEVEARLALASADVFRKALPALANGTLAFVAQDAAAATFCRRLEKADGGLDFHIAARVLAARIRGLFPWPACTITVGGQPLKIGLAEATGAGPMGAAPGVVARAGTDGIEIATPDGVLRLLRLQRAGGRMLPAGDFLRGFPIPEGTVLKSEPMPPLLRAAK